MPGPSALLAHRRVRSLALAVLAVAAAAVARGGFVKSVAALGNMGTLAISAPGTIAYVRNAGELHLIQPDGSSDRVIWTEPAASGGLSNVLLWPSWRPDSSEIAFESTHEQTASVYASDIFSVAPDGSGLRRISNPPDASQFASFPKGNVRLTVTNEDLRDSVFVVFIEGATQPQTVTVAAGYSTVVTFSNVAVFAGKIQPTVAIDGLTRWFGGAPQLVVGGTVDANLQIYASGGQDNFGARKPVWSDDGSELDDYVGMGCVGEAWPASAPPGTTGSPLIQTAESFCPFDRGPTAATANDILYWNYYDFNSGGDGVLYRTTAGSSSPGSPVVDTGYSSFVYDVHYLPDGSGFLWSEKEAADAPASNLYRYDFNSQSWSKLTSFADSFVADFAISPDGQYVVFEHCPQDLVDRSCSASDLWLMKIDGTIVAQPLVANAAQPSWSRGAPTTNNRRFHVFIPDVSH